MRQQKRRFWTAAVLATLLAALPARAQVADGGAPSDGATTPAAVDASSPAADAGSLAPLTNAPEAPAVTANRVATMMLATPAPVEEPSRPITRRLWFWVAITGAVVAGVLIGIAVEHPNHTHPDCPPDYVCPR